MYTQTKRYRKRNTLKLKYNRRPNRALRCHTIYVDLMSFYGIRDYELAIDAQNKFFKIHKNKEVTMPFIEKLGMQAASQASNNLVGGIMGLALGAINDRRQLKQQEKLQNLQISGNKQMMDYSMQKQLQMWKDTNYQAQVGELEKAGLNPALLYGMSGGGGITTGSPGGSVQSGSAPAGGGEVLQMAAMGIQLKGQEAEIKLKEAQARNLDADTANKPLQGQNIEASTTSLLQGVKNAEAQRRLTEVQTNLAKIEEKIKNATSEEAISRIATETQQALVTTDRLERENLLEKGTYNEKVKLIQQSVTESFLRNEAIRAGINVSNAQIQKIVADIANMTEQLRLQRMEVGIKQQGVDIQKIATDNLKSYQDSLIKLGYSKLVVDGISNIVSQFIPGATKQVQHTLTP